MQPANYLLLLSESSLPGWHCKGSTFLLPFAVRSSDHSDVPCPHCGKRNATGGFCKQWSPQQGGIWLTAGDLSLLAGTHVTVPCTENRAPQSPGLGGSVLLLCPKLTLGFTRCHPRPLWCHPAVPAEQGGCCIPAQRQCH